jgi:hypothetical protein
MPPLILLMIAESFSNISRELFSRESLNLIHLGRWKLTTILYQDIKTWLMLSCSNERPECWHRLRQERLEQLIQRCRYRLRNTKKSKGVVTYRRADMSREKLQELVPWGHVLQLISCWINGNDRRKKIISVG